MREARHARRLAALRQLPRLALERAQPSSSAPDSPRAPHWRRWWLRAFCQLARASWVAGPTAMRTPSSPARPHPQAPACRNGRGGRAQDHSNTTSASLTLTIDRDTHKAGSRLSSLSPLQSSQAPAVFMQRLGTPSTPHPPNRVQNSPRVREKRVVGRALASSKNHREVGFLDN